MTKKAISVLTAISVLGVSSLQGAYPLLVDDAAIVAPGETELVLYYEASFNSSEHLHTFPVELTHGIHPRFEAALSTGYQIFDLREDGEKEHGLLDTIIALKGLVFEQGDRPFSFTIEGSLKIPTASESRGLGSGGVDLGIHLAATQEWEKFAVDLNAGYLFAEHFRGRRADGDEWFIGTAVRHDTTDALETFVEAFVEVPVGASRDAVVTARLGGNLEVREDILLGAGIGPSFGPGSPDVVVTAGFTRLF